MFTGIIEEKGTIKELRATGNSSIIKIECHKILGPDTHIGDSISVNGICLTVTNMDATSFTADVMPETIRMSSLDQLNVGSKVNLERAMAANGRFGGHIVSGHIDGTGKIENIRRESNAVWYKIATKRELSPFIVPKGSIAIDGISLTVADTYDRGFMVSIIPHTLEETILCDKKTGDIVNLETDIIGKYVNSLLQGNNAGMTLLNNDLIYQKSTYHN